MTYTRLTSNLSGRVRRETLNGRDYLVAPVVMIVPGVLNGSQGALYYPPDEIGRTPEVWNGMPLTLGHPSENGQPVSARAPRILERFGIGQVFNVRFDRRLSGEAYFDEELCVRRAPRVWASLLAGKPLELSTGLFTENEPKTGTYNGREYVAVARNYRPDHLAILPDTHGACSIRDGCGVLVNSQVERLIEMMRKDPEQPRGRVGRLIEVLKGRQPKPRCGFKRLTSNERELLNPDAHGEDLLIPPTFDSWTANEEQEESAVANERADLLIPPKMVF